MGRCVLEVSLMRSVVLLWGAISCFPAQWDMELDQSPLLFGSFHSPAIICDAGSTGSRIFALFIPKIANVYSDEISVQLLGRTTTGLSTLAEAGLYAEAVASYGLLITRGLVLLGGSTPVYIFATGGVRQMAEDAIEKLWSEMARGLTNFLGDIHHGLITMRTLQGVDEALYGLISANYLVSNLPIAAINGILETPVGVLDLGGSSLELSLPGVDRMLGTHDDILLSFSSLGMSQARTAVGLRDHARVCEFGSVCILFSNMSPLGERKSL